MSHQRALTCLACGVESWDVAMKLIQTEDPAAPYANEPRCRDVKACEGRVADLELRSEELTAEPPAAGWAL